MRIFNTHTHLNDSSVVSVSDLIVQAHDMQVSHLAVVGSDLQTSKKAIEIATQYENVFAICGIHPSDIESFHDDYQTLIQTIKHDKTIGIGEIGLDYYYDEPSKERQLHYFESFLKLATQFQKPVIIHCREAYLDTFNLLEKYHQQLDGIILHCYTGSVEMMQRFLKLGCYISLSGVVTFKNAKEVKKVASVVPLDRLLVETDDPYLTPVPYRGKPNCPAYVYYVLKEIAQIRNMDIEELAEITFCNAL